MRFHEQLVHAPQPLGEDHRQRPVDLRPRTAQHLERVAMKRERLAVGERLHGRAATAVRDQGQLAEGVAGADDREEHGLAGRDHDADGEVARHDEMQRVRGVVVVEDDLAVAEGSPLRNREQAADVLRRDARQETPFHARSVARATHGGSPRRAFSSGGHEVQFPAHREEGARHEDRAYAVVLAAVVALMAASGASAKSPAAHANVRLAHHSYVKQTHMASRRGIDRRWARRLF